MHSKLNQIASYAMKALLYEVSASPKPGLVDRFGPGAHDDMDYYTFIDSTLSLNEMFYKCAKIGSQFEGDDPKELLALLRPVGLIGEKKMLEATSGVNTHKGAIFSMGIVCAAAAMLDESDYQAEKICELVKLMASGLMDELKDTKGKEQLTAGERLYKEHGIVGIRGEVESGFMSVRKYGLPSLRRITKEGLLDRNEMMIEVLMQLMSNVGDSNVISRKGLEGLEFVQKKAKKALELGGVYTEEGWYYIVNMDQSFIERRISPGGAADLLAVTLMLHFLESKGEDVFK